MRRTLCTLCAEGAKVYTEQRPVLLGRPTEEQLNEYNPRNAVMGQRPYGVVNQTTIEQYYLRFRQKLSNDELNPAHLSNWRRYDLIPKENRNNPDSFFYEHYRNGGRAFQQVFHEDMLRLMQYPEDGVVICDVRSDPNKIARYIPFSIRIPVEELHYALQLTPTQFESMYRFPLPEPGVEVICVSHSGVASEKALQIFNRWGHLPDQLFNYRGGTNELFGESHSDWTERAEEITDLDYQKGRYAIGQPDYLAQVSTLHEKYYPYPSEDYAEQRARDKEGKWEYREKVGGEADGPVGKYIRTRRAYQQLVDGQWLRARMVADVQWYDYSHRELPTTWAEPDLSLDRAWKPATFNSREFWRTVPQ